MDHGGYMTNEIYAKFNDDGFVAGFWQSAAYAPPAEGEDRNPIIPADAIKITEAQFDELFNNPQTRKFINGEIVQYDPPAPEPYIPSRVSSRQFKLQLFYAGLIDQVEAWIAQEDRASRITYETSQEFDRNDPTMQLGFSELGFQDEQIDQFFMAAAQL